MLHENFFFLNYFSFDVLPSHARDFSCELDGFFLEKRVTAVFGREWNKCQLLDLLSPPAFWHRILVPYASAAKARRARACLSLVCFHSKPNSRCKLNFHSKPELTPQTEESTKVHIPGSVPLHITNFSRTTRKQNIFNTFNS